MGTVAEAERKPVASRLTEEELLGALPARSANREVKVGLFVLVGLVAFLTILFTMTDVGTFRGRYYVHTTVESAGGMRRGDPVQMRGVNVGRVIDFNMVGDGVDVQMEVYDEYPIPADSRVEIKSNGLLGGMVVDIVPGLANERVADEGVLPGESETGIMSAADAIGQRADTALARVNMLLSEQTIGNVGGSVEELQSLLLELNAIANQQRAEIAALTASLRRSASGVEAAATGPELQQSLRNIEALTAQFGATARTLNEASASINEASASFQTVASRLENGDGTLGKLSTDEELYNNLNAAVQNLNSLVDDLKANPRKYFNLEVF